MTDKKRKTNNPVYEKGEERKNLCNKIKEMLIEQLSLEMIPEFITNDQPVFGRGLELDSIDALDISVGLFDTFGVQIDDDNTEVFSSVNKMADYIQMQN